jgi:hypothetical protein
MYSHMGEAGRNMSPGLAGVDTVVVACGGKENNALYYALKDQVKELHMVGDVNAVRKVPDATMDGATLGRWL